MINSTMGAGMAGIQQGYDMLERSSDQIAKASIPSDKGEAVSLAEATVTQMEGKNQVQASAKVVETASEVLGTLIDVKV